MGMRKHLYFFFAVAMAYFLLGRHDVLLRQSLQNVHDCHITQNASSHQLKKDTKKPIRPSIRTKAWDNEFFYLPASLFEPLTAILYFAPISESAYTCILVSAPRFRTTLRGPPDC